MTGKIWRGVPLDKIEAWQIAFQVSSDSYNVSGACPVCFNHALMRYYYLGRNDPRDFRGVAFKGRGGLWEWCSNCKVYSHSQAFVPESWKGPELKLDHARLTPVPDVIDDLISAAKRPGSKPEK
jgi:hypothetical protein